MSDLPTLCDQRGDHGCCGTPACATAGIWNSDPYFGPPVFIQGHMHAEPACAYWDCTTTLSRSAMATRQKLTTPPAPTTDPRAEEARKALGESEES